MFCFYLFVFQDYYFNITNTKYQFFAWSTTICFLLFLFQSFLRKKQIIPHNLSKIELCLLIWIGIQTISVLFSDYKLESFLGSSGRNTGLLFSIFCVIGYFIVSRSQRNIKHIVFLFLISCNILNILALLNFFSIDPFGFYTHLSDYQSSFYLSTSGNINFFASIVCLSLPISSYLFLVNKERPMIYLLMSINGFIALLISNSDSGFLGIGFMFLVLLFFCTKDVILLQRWLLLFFSFLTSAKLLYFLSIFMPIASRPFITLSNFFVNETPSWFLWMFSLLFLWIVTIKQQQIHSFLPSIKKILLIATIAAFITILFSFLYFSFYDQTTTLGYYTNYLRWNDQWGTGRAYAWKNALNAFSSFSPVQMMFGFGPDTTHLIMKKYYATDQILIQYDNAHNEYIQYLITTGVLGLIAYLSIWATFFNQVIRTRAAYFDQTKAIALAIAVYLLQSIVNINQPISTPLLFLLLALSVGKKTNCVS